MFKYFYVCLQVENIRRKHNYLPLIMELLKVLAKQGNLVPLVEKVRRSYLLLPAWYHVSSNSLRTPPLKWTTWNALCSVRSMGMWGDWISAVFMCIAGLSIVLVRSCRSCCERTLARALPHLCHTELLPVFPIQNGDPTIESLQPNHFSSCKKLGWFMETTACKITCKFWLIVYSLFTF